MNCQICGRNSCCKSFHSLEEQESFDNVSDNIKIKIYDDLIYHIDRCESIEQEDKLYISYDEMREVIENIY